MTKDNKESKKRKQTVETTSIKPDIDNIDTENITTVIDDMQPVKKKKKKHKTREIDEDTNVNLELEVQVNDNVSPKKSKKKKRKHSDSEKSNNLEEEEYMYMMSQCKKKKSSDDDQNMHENGKEKKKNRTLNGNDKSDFVCMENYKDHQKHKKKKHKKEESDLETSKCHYEVIKKKKKKKCKEDSIERKRDELVNDDSTENSAHEDSTENRKKRKKKKKKSKHKCSGEESIQSCIDIDMTDRTENDKICKESQKRKKKDKRNKESKEADCCNVTRNEKNLKSVERESIQQNDGKSISHQSGQWGTAFNENKDRQNKFLRLLGGFKKGNEDQTSKAQKFTTKFANFAMDQSTERNYQKNLEDQYDKAMTSNLQRGIGLGFQPPPDAGKKFYIDKGVSKSIKFDD